MQIYEKIPECGKTGLYFCFEKGFIMLPAAFLMAQIKDLERISDIDSRKKY